MTFDLAQMIADREAGTPGEWFINGPTWNQIVWTDNETRLCFMTHSNGLNDARDEANARRIARVPLLEAEIIRLTARVERLEGALGAIADLASISGNEFKAKHPALNAALDKVGQPNWGEELSWFAHDRLEEDRAALSTPTEEPKT